MGKQKDHAEAQVLHLEKEMMELKQQLQDEQQKLINFHQMQNNQQEEYTRSVSCLGQS